MYVQLTKFVLITCFRTAAEVHTKANLSIAPRAVFFERDVIGMYKSRMQLNVLTGSSERFPPSLTQDIFPR